MAPRSSNSPTGRHRDSPTCCYEYTIVTVPRIARRYTIGLLSAARQKKTRTRCYIELDGGVREGGMKEGREDGREDGRGEGGSKGRERER